MTGSSPHRLPVVAGVVDLWSAAVERADGSTLPLTQLEVGLLRYLAARPAMPVTREILLRDVWGVDGSLRTRAVDAAVKRLRRKIERDASDPDHLRKVHGVGYAFYPLRPVATVQRPGPGRPSLGATVMAALERWGHVTLVGPPGVGKSWLARQVAERSGARVVWVDATAAGTADDVAHAVLEAVGAPGPATSVGDVVRELAPVTLVIDGADAVGAGALPPVGGDDGVAVLVTRRSPFGVTGEEVVVVPPLPPEDAVTLFEALSEAAGRPIAPDEVPDVAALVDRLDGVPLAIELAVGRTAVLSPRELVRLYDREGGAAVAPPLMAAIARSWRALDPSDRQALACLAAFHGPFPLHAAAAVLDRPLDAVVGVLQDLAERSLIHPATSSSGTRYAMLRALREIAGASTPDGARERWRRWCLDAVSTGMADEVARADLVALLGDTEGEERLRVACALDERDRDGRSLDEVAGRLREALEGAVDASDDVRAEALLRLGRALGLAGAHAEAAAVLARVGGLASARPILGLRAAIGLATARRIGGDLDGAERALGPALASDEPEIRGMALWGLGVIARARGDLRASREHLMDAIETGDVRSRGMALESLGMIHREAGEAARTRTLLRRAADTLGVVDEIARAHVCCNLGMLELDAGDLEAAAAWFEDARRTSRCFGDPEVGRLARAGLALTAVLAGTDDAAARVRAALRGDASGLAEAMRHLAAAGLAGPNDAAAAVAHLSRAEAAAGPPTRGAVAWLRARATARLAPTRAGRIDAEVPESPLVAALKAVGVRPARDRVLVGACLAGLVPLVAG